MCLLRLFNTFSVNFESQSTNYFWKSLQIFLFTAKRGAAAAGDGYRGSRGEHGPADQHQQRVQPPAVLRGLRPRDRLQDAEHPLLPHQRQQRGHRRGRALQQAVRITLHQVRRGDGHGLQVHR